MRIARFRSAVLTPRRQYGKRGQGLVEFALVAPVFFAVIFAMIDGGLLLYSVNAVDHSTTIGTNAIAGIGRGSTADITALQRMASAGLETTALAVVTEVDVEGLVTNASLDGFAIHSDGTPVVQTGCAGGPGGVDGPNECIDQYKFNGSAVVVINGTCAPTIDASQCPPWPPSARDVANGESSFVALKVSYSYHFITGITGAFNLTSTKTFRLEPQSNPN